MPSICSTPPGRQRKLLKSFYGEVKVDYIPISLAGGNIDFTDPDGITGGFCPRGLFVSGDAGNVIVEPIYTTEQRTIPVAAKERLELGIAGIVASGTTATSLFAIL